MCGSRGRCSTRGGWWKTLATSRRGMVRWTFVVRTSPSALASPNARSVSSSSVLCAPSSLGGHIEPGSNTPVATARARGPRSHLPMVTSIPRMMTLATPMMIPFVVQTTSTTMTTTVSTSGRAAMIRSEPALDEVIRDDCSRLWCTCMLIVMVMDVFYGLFRRLPTRPLLFRLLSTVVDFD